MVYEGKYEQVKEIIRNPSDHFPHFKYVEAVLNYELGKYSDASSILVNLIQQESNIDDDTLMIYIKISSAHVDWRLNRLQDASIKLLNIQKHLSKVELPDDERYFFETWLSHIESIISWSLGDIENAIELNKENLAKFQTIGNNRMASLSLNNLGVLYTERGKFVDGLLAFEQSFNINDEKYVADYARTKNNLSNLYRDLGEFSEAIKQAEEALEIQNTLGNPFEISGTLYSLVILYSQVKLSGKMVAYHSNLVKIAEETDDVTVFIRSELSSILVLKESFKLRDKYEALLRLKNLSKRTDIRSDLLVTTLKFYCELLFFDWKLTGDNELINEIQEILNRLQYISRYQKSILLESEVYFLKSQVDALENNFNQAKENLRVALQITQDNGYHNMAMRVSNALDQILQKETEYNNTESGDSSYQQDGTSIEDYFERYAISPHFKPKMEQEMPVMFLILKHEEGLLIYSHHFVDEEQINEHLLSSFISAVNSFASSTFKTGNLDRIKSGDFTLLINSNNNLMFVYIFRGYSYYGMPKLNYLADKLSELSVLNEVKDKYSISHNEQQILETEIMKVISAQYDRI